MTDKKQPAKRLVKFFIWNIILIAFDQITKYLAFTQLRNSDDIVIIPGVFRLQYLENRGAAFGAFQNKLIFLIIITFIILAGITFLLMKLPYEKRYLPIEYICIFIFAGAIGNFIDRMFHNYVIDFLYFELINFPIFNVADCYVTVCAILFLVLCIFYYKDEDFDFLKKQKDIP